jgi:hypothetical protein
MKRVFQDNWASMIIVDGPIGSGKTTMAVHMADFINGAYVRDDSGHFFVCEEKLIDLKKQLAHGGDDFRSKLAYCYANSLRVLVYDEAGDFTSRGALLKFNKLLNETFEKYRAFKVIVILTLPSFSTIDKSLIDKEIPRLLIHIQNRNNSYGKFKLYGYYRMSKVKFLMSTMSVKVEAYRFWPNTQGVFYDLPKDRNNLLAKVTTDSKFHSLQESTLLYDDLVNFKMLARELGRTTSWVQRALKALDIKPVQVYKCASYFDRSVLETLRREKKNA